MANLNFKKSTRLRVHAFERALVGGNIDISHCPDGHLSCPKCQNPYFETWFEVGEHKILIGCVKCGWSSKMLFPVDVDLNLFGKNGKWSCLKHKQAENAIIKNGQCVCIGCRYCMSQAIITLKSETGLVVM